MPTATISRTISYQRDIDRLVQKSYTYLLRNFAKFSVENKIKVALKIIDKHMDVELARLMKDKKDEEFVNSEIEFVGVPGNGDGKEIYRRFYNN
jgi:hypothetical protein